MSLPMNMAARTATITSGTSLSAAVAVGPHVLVGIGMPAAWDAAGLSFQVSVDGATWLEMASVSAPLAYVAAAGQFVAVDPALWRGVALIKVRSGTAATPVAQSADRAVSLITRVC